jgi:benzoate membrane transport protein
MTSPNLPEPVAFKFEKAPGFFGGLKDVWKHMTIATVGSGVVAWFFGATKALIILKIAETNGLDPAVTASWIFMLYLTSGLIGIFLVLHYRIPIGMAWPIPAAVFIGNSLANKMPLPEIFGSFFLVGAIVAILGWSGLVTRIMKLCPTPIVMGMIAGVFIKFGIDIVKPVTDSSANMIWIWLITFVTFIAVARTRWLSEKFPATLAALIGGTIAVAAFGEAKIDAFHVSMPNVAYQGIAFTFRGFLELTIPTVLTIIGANNMQAFGVLMVQGYTPPVSAITTTGGLGAMLNACFGASTSSVAGPTTALLVDPSAGPKEGRYAAGFVNAVLWVVFAFFATAVVAITNVVPRPFIEMVAGLAMLGVLVSSFGTAFGGKHRIGAIFALLIANWNGVVLGIGGPFWALVAGVILSRLFEPGDFSADDSGKATGTVFR